MRAHPHRLEFKEIFMAYGHAPLNIAGSYTGGRKATRTNESATNLVWQLQKEATRQGEVERARTTKINMEILGDSVKKLSENIAYLTGGYKLDQAVQMKQLDVAALVQERLADEAMAAGPLVGFDPGPDPDQAMAEVEERSGQSGGGGQQSPFPATEGSVPDDTGEVVTPSGPPVTGQDVILDKDMPGPQQPPVSGEQDVRSDYKPETGGTYATPPKKGRAAGDNVAAVRDRGAAASGGRPPRPSRPRRAPHTNVGTTEIFVNPTTGGMFARTARGLAVPISEGTFRNLLQLQEANSERHLFNHTAAYEDSLARWYDSLTNEQTAANSALSTALIDSYVNAGYLTEDEAAALRRAASAGSEPEEVLAIINAHQKAKRSGNLDSSGMSDLMLASYKSFAYQNKAQASSRREQIEALSSKIDGLRTANSAILKEGSKQELLPDELAAFNENEERIRSGELRAERLRMEASIHDALSNIQHRTAIHPGLMIPQSRTDMADLALLNAGIPGRNASERRSNVRNKDYLSTDDIENINQEWALLHRQYGFNPPDQYSWSILHDELAVAGADLGLLAEAYRSRLSVEEEIKRAQEKAVAAGEQPVPPVEQGRGSAPANTGETTQATRNWQEHVSGAFDILGFKVEQKLLEEAADHLGPMLVSSPEDDRMLALKLLDPSLDYNEAFAMAKAHLGAKGESYQSLIITSALTLKDTYLSGGIMDHRYTKSGHLIPQPWMGHDAFQVAAREDEYVRSQRLSRLDRQAEADRRKSGATTGPSAPFE